MSSLFWRTMRGCIETPCQFGTCKNMLSFFLILSFYQVGAQTLRANFSQELDELEEELKEELEVLCSHSSPFNARNLCLSLTCLLLLLVLAPLLCRESLDWLEQLRLFVFLRVKLLAQNCFISWIGRLKLPGSRPLHACSLPTFWSLSPLSHNVVETAWVLPFCTAQSLYTRL